MAHGGATGWVAGVDAGGTKVAVLVADPDGRACGTVTTATDLSSPTGTIAGIADAVRSALELTGIPLSAVGAVGLGVPGRVHGGTGVVRHAVNLKWHELPAGPDLAARLGVPCFVENDVRVAALGLQRHPAYAHVDNLAYVNIGTGIAAGLILGGRLYTGSHGMAGEIGHMIAEPGGPRCGCGTRGCLEALAAGPAIARQGREAVATGAATLLRTAVPLTAARVYEAALGGDAPAGAIVDRVGATLARTVQQLVMTYDVECIVFGGGVARAGAAFLQPILRAITRLGHDSALVRELVRPEMIHLLPPDYDPGTWGAVTLAQAHLPAAMLPMKG
ncbi:MAG TPA: ROK family protein [Chloroflexia bacterium]|nr:ROK family protein [Chloroflexia bacterium]